jgi:hypothetical protein
LTQVPALPHLEALCWFVIGEFVFYGSKALRDQDLFAGSSAIYLNQFDFEF